uniref:Putative neurotoxin LTDF S-07 n=1 Tax=Dolomedes fimbriatus TaxID=1432569 RepID=A0A0K1D8G6_9ARAC|nr:putative neurotoxin LTDF S-07 [Dolomedes fimbriatus]
MKILFVFISVLYLVYSFTLEEEMEALELLDEIAVQDAESLQTDDAVEERKRSCTRRGQSCEDDCECCADDWDTCSCTFGLFGCSCAHGTARDCYIKAEKCANKPKKCHMPGQNPRNG